MGCIQESSASFLQIQIEKTFWVLEACEVFVNASPAEPRPVCPSESQLPEPNERLWKTHASSVSRCLHCRKFHWYMQLGIKDVDLSPKILEATQSGRVAKLHIPRNLHGFRPLLPLVLLSSASDRTPVEVRRRKRHRFLGNDTNYFKSILNDTKWH